MPDLKSYDIFISHAWRYSDSYRNLSDLLDAAVNFDYRNYSVPRHDPLIDPTSSAGRDKLGRALDGQIRPVNCVLIIAGMYGAHRYWIQKEIDIAGQYEKPIVGLIPHGHERTPEVVQQAALEMVGWSTASIVAAIRKHAI